MKQSKRMERNEIRSAPLGRNGVGLPHTEGPLTTRLRGLLALGVCLCLVLALLPAPAQAAAPTTNWADEGNYDTAWYGDGSAAEFTISTAAELAGLAKLSNGGNDFAGKTITLAADVDLSAHLWTPIKEAWSTYFSGTFDGGGHTIRGLTVSKLGLPAGSTDCGGLFGFIGAGGTVHGIRIVDASVSIQAGGEQYVGILAGQNKGTVYDCSASGSVSADCTASSESPVYAGGLVGKSDGTVKNSSAMLTSVTGKGTVANTGICYVGGIAGSGTAENCFADTKAAPITAGGMTMKQYRVAPTASYSYWDAATKLTDGGTPAYTQCYAVTAEQIAGTGSTPIAVDGTYANTPFLLTALNNWVGAVTGNYWGWKLNEAGMPVVMPPASYIDINAPLNDVNHQNPTGDIETGMSLEGQMRRNLTLLSVTLPASIPFIVDMEGNGAFKRVISATGKLTNLSDCGVNVTLTAVADGGGLLDKVNLFLIPDPAPAGGNVTLAAGTGKTNLLAALDAPAAGSATNATVKVDGTDKLNGAAVGIDGQQYTVDLTLKVSKQ